MCQLMLMTKSCSTKQGFSRLTAVITSRMTWNGALALLGRISLKPGRFLFALCSRVPNFLFSMFLCARENRAIGCTHGLNSSNDIGYLTLADEIIKGENPAYPLLFRSFPTLV
jgi:hypothetical protein